MAKVPGTPGSAEDVVVTNSARRRCLSACLTPTRRERLEDNGPTTMCFRSRRFGDGEPGQEIVRQTSCLRKATSLLEVPLRRVGGYESEALMKGNGYIDFVLCNASTG